MKADYNKLMYLNIEVEYLYGYFKDTHQNLLNIVDIAECLDDEKSDEYHSYVKEYEASLELLKSNFLLLKSHNKKIESCISQTKLLKKKRLKKLESNISKNHYNNYDNDNDNDDDGLPF